MTQERTAMASARDADRPLGANRREITIRDIMSHNVLTVDSGQSICSAAEMMSRNGVSCLVILDEESVFGILTEKDILKDVATGDIDSRQVRISDRMSSPVEVAVPGMSVIAAGTFMEARGIKHLPIVSATRSPSRNKGAGRLVGIVTQTDITRGLTSGSPLRDVVRIMTTEIATVEAEAVVAQAAHIMTAKGISCIVVVQRNAVVGILTEKDVVKRVVALGKDPGQIRVADVMSAPIVAVASGCSVLSASSRMHKRHIHRLVVMDGKKVAGIVTQTDILKVIRSELEGLKHQRRVSTAELATLAQYTIGDLGQLRNLLNQLAAP